jgi:hypothetical protein
LQDAIRSANADRGGHCRRDVDHAGWAMTLHHPEDKAFSGRTREEALVWRMAPELGVGILRAPCMTQNSGTVTRDVGSRYGMTSTITGARHGRTPG